MVDDAHIGSGANYGGLVAAPVFSKIGEASARYLDLLPSLSSNSISKGNPPTDTNSSEMASVKTLTK